MTKQSISQYLKNDSKTLGLLLSKLKQLQQWNKHLHNCLSHEPRLLDHCQVVNLLNNSLIILIDSPHWLTRIRFHVPELLPKMRLCVGLEQIREIICKIHPNYNQNKFNQWRQQTRPTLKLQTANLIRETANKMPDEKLRAILEKIAARAEPINEDD